MRKSVVALVASAVLGIAPTVVAASVSLDLNCLWSGGTCGYQSPSHGTNTISHSGSFTKDANGFYAVAGVHNGSNATTGARGDTPQPVVPEPASLTLLGSGLFGLAATVRRRLPR